MERGDDRIWDAIEQQRKDIGSLTTGVAVLAVEVRTVGAKMDAYKQPCEGFQKHLDEHEQAEAAQELAAQETAREKRQDWKDLAKQIAAPVLSAIGTMIAIYLGMQV